MSDAAGQGDEERRVEELLRVNAALAAEVRSLTLGRTDAPRSSPMPTSRRLASILEEREALKEQLEETRDGLTAMTASRDELAGQNQELLAQIARLRSGYAGFLRRLRARLLNR
jgi:DNA anti-recombination protein RmuC